MIIGVPSNVNVERFVHSANTVSLFEHSIRYIYTLNDALLHPLNAELPVEDTVDVAVKVTVARDTQLSNALTPAVVILVGIVIDVIPLNSLIYFEKEL